MVTSFHVLSNSLFTNRPTVRRYIYSDNRHRPCMSTVWLYSPLLDLGRFFSFLILFTAFRTPWTGDQPFARPLPTHRTTQTQNKRTHTSMPRVGFEPTIPAFEPAKTVHDLDRVATVIGDPYIYDK
jgi:hypothetical protein